MKPSELIREARNILFERGWYQGASKGPDGSVCVMGAVFYAEDKLREYGQFSAAMACFAAVLPSHYRTVQCWNDMPGRTFGEVVDLFDKAEKIAERDE